MKIEGACHPLISECPFKLSLAYDSISHSSPIQPSTMCFYDTSYLCHVTHSCSQTVTSCGSNCRALELKNGPLQAVSVWCLKRRDILRWPAFGLALSLSRSSHSPSMLSFINVIEQLCIV